jgi:hypothetical protein
LTTFFHKTAGQEGIFVRLFTFHRTLAGLLGAGQRQTLNKLSLEDEEHD